MTRNVWLIDSLAIIRCICLVVAYSWLLLVTFLLTFNRNRKTTKPTNISCCEKKPSLKVIWNSPKTLFEQRKWKFGNIRKLFTYGLKYDWVLHGVSWHLLVWFESKWTPILHLDLDLRIYKTFHRKICDRNLMLPCNGFHGDALWFLFDKPTDKDSIHYEDNRIKRKTISKMLKFYPSRLKLIFGIR